MISADEEAAEDLDKAVGYFEDRKSEPETDMARDEGDEVGQLEREQLTQMRLSA